MSVELWAIYFFAWFVHNIQSKCISFIVLNHMCLWLWDLRKDKPVESLSNFLHCFIVPSYGAQQNLVQLFYNHIKVELHSRIIMITPKCYNSLIYSIYYTCGWKNHPQSHSWWSFVMFSASTFFDIRIRYLNFLWFWDRFTSTSFHCHPISLELSFKLLWI